MTDDLVARLLEKARSGQAYGGVTLCEAADALEAQAKRIAELETREKHLEEMFEGWRGEAIKASARIAEQDYVLEMIWRAEDRAARAWQAKTGEHLTWPDQAKVVEWLMDELDAARARIAELETALVDVTARLVAAVSLLERGGKKAAPSNKMFDQMIVDYKNCIERSRAALNGERNDGD